jgi:coenzyme F420-reducing hydrogenase beta subunit
MRFRELHSGANTEVCVSPKKIISSGLCIGCGTCAVTTGTGKMQWDEYGQLKPWLEPRALRQPSKVFSRTCPFSPSAPDETELAARRFPAASHQDELIGRFEAAYVGHAAQGSFRKAGSSGGMVSWVATRLLHEGLVDAVAHVVPREVSSQEPRLFHYQISRDPEELARGAKSRYYPVDLTDVLTSIRATPGRYAVVGIPCFIKAVTLLCAEDAVLRQRIAVTLGLFCGHMKSARMVDSFAWQMNVSRDDIRDVDFRLKNTARPANWYTAQLTRADGSKERKDWWHLVDGDWGAGFFQNSACNYCDDVVAETADISFGDAWVEPYSSDGGGANVVIARSSSLNDLLRAGIGECELALQEVDSKFVEATQAAGFRQRREGLAYRLTWPRTGLRPKKRVTPSGRGLSIRRKLIYLTRYLVSAWSHRVFRAANLLNLPGLYLGWASMSLSLYQGLAYSRGRAGRIADRVEAFFHQNRQSQR